MHRDLLAGNFDRVVKTQFVNSGDVREPEGLIEDYRLRDFLARL
jgi:hypothetical protein